jgi:hypothetical protein
MNKKINQLLAIRKEQIKNTKIEDVIGIHLEKDNNAYCLGRYMNDSFFISILSKTIKDEKEFWEEVNNLAKYFNAKIIK